MIVVETVLSRVFSLLPLTLFFTKSGQKFRLKVIFFFFSSLSLSLACFSSSSQEENISKQSFWRTRKFTIFLFWFLTFFPDLKNCLRFLSLKLSRIVCLLHVATVVVTASTWKCFIFWNIFKCLMCFLLYSLWWHLLSVSGGVRSRWKYMKHKRGKEKLKTLNWFSYFF